MEVKLALAMEKEKCKLTAFLNASKHLLWKVNLSKDHCKVYFDSVLITVMMYANLL